MDVFRRLLAGADIPVRSSRVFAAVAAKITSDDLKWLCDPAMHADHSIECLYLVEGGRGDPDVFFVVRFASRRAQDEIAEWWQRRPDADRDLRLLSCAMSHIDSSHPGLGDVFYDYRTCTPYQQDLFDLVADTRAGMTYEDLLACPEHLGFLADRPAFVARLLEEAKNRS